MSTAHFYVRLTTGHDLCIMFSHCAQRTGSFEKRWKLISQLWQLNPEQSVTQQCSLERPTLFFLWNINVSFHYFLLFDSSSAQVLYLSISLLLWLELESKSINQESRKLTCWSLARSEVQHRAAAQTACTCETLGRDCNEVRSLTSGKNCLALRWLDIFMTHCCILTCQGWRYRTNTIISADTWCIS